jgi:purine nucleosidase
LEETIAIPTILDTDIGTDVDDAIALLLACSSPEIELLAVTTTGGETTRRARLAKKILKTCGKDEVPVFPGINTRLLPHRPNHLNPYHGHGITTDDIRQHEIENEHAVEYLIHMTQNTVLVTIGPLSNLGATLVLDDTATDRLRSLYIMGGSF